MVIGDGEDSRPAGGALQQKTMVSRSGSQPGHQGVLCLGYMIVKKTKVMSWTWKFPGRPYEV